MARSRASHYKVKGITIDGKHEGTLTIEATLASGVTLISARPLRGRSYTMTLKDVFEMICWHVARKESNR